MNVFPTKTFFFRVLLLLSTQFVSAQIDLFQAARVNDTIAVQKYIDQGYKMDIVNSRGYSLLIIACYNESKSVVQLLLDHGADINFQDRMGNTALMGTLFRGYDAIGKILIENKSTTLNLRNFNGATALFFASTFNRIYMVKLLLSKNIDKNIQDNFGKRAIDHAIIQENTEIVDLLK